MKKSIFLSVAVLFICIFCVRCETSKEEMPRDRDIDYFSHLNNHIRVNKNDANIIFDLFGTRSQGNVSYKITASLPDENLEIISYLYIDKLSSGYLFEHYTEDKLLIASMQCDNNFILEDVYIPDYVETRGFRFWWACTQIEYQKTKQQQSEMGMVMDICSDWLPMATINGVMAGLYCMGTK